MTACPPGRPSTEAGGDQEKEEMGGAQKPTVPTETGTTALSPASGDPKSAFLKGGSGSQKGKSSYLLLNRKFANPRSRQ